MFLTYPFVVLSELLTNIIANKKQPLSVSREEVSAIVTVGAEEGVLEKKENSMIQHLLKLDDITARDIMTPSSVVEMAEENMTLSEFYKNDAYRTYSRIPVFNEENDDFIKGYVLRQTILEKLSEDRFDTRLSEIVRPILTFQETDSVSKIWEELLAKKEHISVIIDESDLLCEKARTEDFIIMGRCGDRILSHNGIPHLSVFITAPFEKRVQRIMATDDLTEKQARKLLKTLDRRHGSYYNFYTGRRWGDPNSYDLCINSASYGIEGSVELIKRMVDRQSYKKPASNK